MARSCAPCPPARGLLVGFALLVGKLRFAHATTLTQSNCRAFAV